MMSPMSGLNELYKKPPFDIKKNPNCSRGYQYALDVLAGEIPACIYLIGACERFLREINTKHPDYYFVVETAEKYLRTVQKFEHTEGHWATKNIVYEPWQCWVWMNIMGFYNKKTSFRRFRIAHVDIARGNAKSTMASQAALYFLALDNPNGNKISTFATKQAQARIVFDSAKSMAKKNVSFIKATGVEVREHSVIHKGSDSILRPLASNSKSMDGFNDVLAILDELHAMARKVFDVIISGMSKRKDSLALCITTAGDDIQSVGYSQNQYAKKVCLGEVVDDQMFAVVYTLDKDDDIYDERNWLKANPNWITSVDDVSFRAKALKTKEVPADLPNFKIKHLNIWTAEVAAFFDVAKWKSCENKNLKESDFRGYICKQALDLASYIDLSSICRVYYRDKKYYFFWENYLPEESIRTMNNDIYHEAVKTGDLISTPGEVISYEKLGERCKIILKESKVSEFAYDPWRAAQLSQELGGLVEMIEFPMRIGNFSEPMKKLDALMREGLVEHNGSALISWCLGNVIPVRDANDNVRPTKSHEKLKIDPIVAALMALALWLRDETKDSVYESRGIRVM